MLKIRKVNWLVILMQRKG